MKKAVIDFEICSMAYLYSVELISANIIEFATISLSKSASNLNLIWSSFLPLEYIAIRTYTTIPLKIKLEFCPLL